MGANAAFSHDGARIAYVLAPAARRWDAELWTVGIDGTNRRQLATGVDVGRWVNYPLWSPDDRFLAVLRTEHETSPQFNAFPYVQTISMIDVATGEETPLVRSAIPALEDEMRLYIFPLDWSADGSSFFYRKAAAGHVELWQVDVASLETQFVAAISELGIPRCYFLSPDGQWLLCSVQVSSDPSEYAVVRVPTEPGGEAEVLMRGASDDKYSPVWGPGDDEVTINLPSTAGEPARLQTLNVDTYQATTLDSIDDANFAPFAWSPDGQWLATSMYGVWQVLLVARDGSQALQLEDVGQFIGWLDNSPTGSTTGQ